MRSIRKRTLLSRERTHGNGRTKTTKNKQVDPTKAAAKREQIGGKNDQPKYQFRTVGVRHGAHPPFGRSTGTGKPNVEDTTSNHFMMEEVPHALCLDDSLQSEPGVHGDIGLEV